MRCALPQLPTFGPASRGRSVLLAGILLLALLVPRLATFGEHHHAQGALTAEPCAACLVAQTPSVAVEAFELAGALSGVEASSDWPPALPHVTAFDSAVPLACGPPA